MYQSGYNFQSFYTVTYGNGCSWSTAASNSSPGTPSNTSTCLLSTRISPLSSQSSNTSVAFNTLSITSGTSTTPSTTDNTTTIATTAYVKNQAYAKYDVTNANYKLSGGGLVTWNVDTRTVTWNQRVIAINLNSAYASAGYFDIGNFNNSTSYSFTGDWQALYYLPISSTNAFSSSNFRVVTVDATGNWTATIGENWIFICGMNTDDRSLKWNPGSVCIPDKGSFDSNNGTLSCNVSTYNIPNIASTGGYVYLGTFYPKYSGASINVKVVSHSRTDYPVIGYDYTLDIYFKKGDPVNAYGNDANSYCMVYDRAFNGDLLNYLGNNGGNNVYWVSDLGGASATRYSLYVYQLPYNTCSFYTVSYNTFSVNTSGAYWTNSTSASVQVSPVATVANTASCVVAAPITPLSSNATYTSPTFAGMNLADSNSNAIFSTINNLDANSNKTFLNITANGGNAKCGINLNPWNGRSGGPSCIIGAYDLTYGADFFIKTALTGNSANTAASRIYITGSNGYVGIGTETPGNLLEVAGNAKFTGIYVTGQYGGLTNGVVYYIYGYGTTIGTVTTINTSQYVGIKADKLIQSAIGFLVASDNRIKKNIEYLSPEDSLELIQRLKPAKFNYVDVTKGTNKKYGYIAQEVKSVLPTVINHSSDYIPNIFEIVQIDTTQTKIILSTKTTDLFELPKDENQKIKLKFYDASNNEILREVEEIIDDKTFLLSKPISEQKLFLYGQEVSDFHSLEHEQINAVLLSAVQGQQKKIEDLENKIEDLESKTVSLEKKIEDLENKIEFLMTKISP
jgi:hypothetical protein